jgi:hypothetical protein
MKPIENLKTGDWVLVNTHSPFRHSQLKLIQLGEEAWNPHMGIVPIQTFLSADHRYYYNDGIGAGGYRTIVRKVIPKDKPTMLDETS